jgi:hypothetical protein
MRPDRLRRLHRGAFRGAGLALGVVAAACALRGPSALPPPTLRARSAPRLQLPALPPEAPAPPAADEMPGRKLRYLEVALDQMRRLEEQSGGGLDPQRLGAGALAAAALAAAGRPGAGEAARWTAALLDACAGRWQAGNCDRAELAAQRLFLQYPAVLPAELAARLRAAAEDGGPAPPPEAVSHPWQFAETENQRIVLAARSLVGARIAAGTAAGGIAAGTAAVEQGWAAYTEAFLVAHERDGWYEAESPGYMAISINALLHLADHAPRPRVRALAARQLDLLFAGWAREQVEGYPAGPRSRTYVQWALGAGTTPWLAWAWLLGGVGDGGRIVFMDWPELAVTGYAPPPAVARLLAGRRCLPPYEIKARRTIALLRRRALDAALYSYATPDYIVGVAQAVAGLRLGVSGGQEIVATVYAAAPDFAPLYLWSRTRNPTSDRWKSWARDDLAMGSGNVVLARLGARGGSTGHAYFAAPWSRPEVVSRGDGAKGARGDLGDLIIARCGDTYVALITEGGWEVAPAPERFPAYYGAEFARSWVAVPRRQPADVAMQLGRRAEHGDFASWRLRAAAARLDLAGGELRFTTSGGTLLTFLPGTSGSVAGRPIAVGEAEKRQ